jgi:hypothetical protein
MLFAKAGRHIPTSSAFQGVNPLGWYRLSSWDDPWYMADLGHLYQSG